MDVLGVNITDVVVVTVLISGAIALARGLVKEVLAIASWVGAAFATLYGFSYASPYARKMIETPWVADLTAGGVLFIVTLFVLRSASCSGCCAAPFLSASPISPSAGSSR